MASLRFRAAGADDAEKVALLHADSWRRHYRGAYADSYLDGDILTERREVWTSRLATPGHTTTILAEDGTELAGFVHVVFDDDDRWGSLVDNLHVVYHRKRTGLGRTLLARAAAATTDQAAADPIYLWVLEQNVDARRFYEALGGTRIDKAAVPPPGGRPDRLNGTPGKLRFSWPDAASLAREGGSRPAGGTPR